MLEVRDLQTSYGRSQVLFKIDLQIKEGEVVSLMGRNGMGKTTTVRSVMGLTRPKSGEIRFHGKSLFGSPSYRIAQAGLGLVPEGRQVFPNLTVHENLVATAANRSGSKDGWSLERVFSLFPNLKGRKANFGNQLSGGEQQMLAIGRALMTNPRLLILDEATEGLAPLVREEIWKSLAALKALGQSILVIDKHLAKLLPIADRHFVVEKGRVVFSGTSAELQAHPEVRERYVGV